MYAGRVPPVLNATVLPTKLVESTDGQSGSTLIFPNEKLLLEALLI